MSIRHGSCPQPSHRTVCGVRAGVVLLAAAVAAGFGSAPAGAEIASSPVTSAPTSSQATEAPSVAKPTVAKPSVAARTVSYGGVSVQVPAAWRVVDLATTPGSCVRLDVATVYTGPASAQQDCPAHLVGRADTIWLAPSPAPSALPNGRVGAMRAQVAANATSHQELAAVAGRKVVIQATWGSTRDVLDGVLATVVGTSGVVPQSDLHRSGTSPSLTRTNASAPNVSAPSAASADARAVPAATPVGAPSVYTGLGMDSCAAPSLQTMDAWKSSPYRAAGIYIGGSQRACGDGNLSAAWVSSVSAAGWGLIPIYVGLQAPCVNQSAVAKISPATAASQGTSAAADAIVQARRFGVGTGRPIYYDMENYGSDSVCRTAVLSFLSAWTSVLHRSGYLSGVYGGPGSVMSDMAAAGAGFASPDHVWFAQWNGMADTRSQYVYPRFPETKWANHQRLHQYVGNTSEIWGAVRMQIDVNWVDATLAGNAVPVDYGNHTTGPVGAGFGWTGPMSSWRSMPGQGHSGHAAWSGSSGSSQEVNGASWSVYLTPGTYNAMAYLPTLNSDGKARYTVTGAGVSTGSVLDQSGQKGYRAVGTFALRSAGVVTVHVGDNGGSAAGTPFAVDALWFQPVAPPKPAVPGAVARVSATVSSASSTVGWTAPTAGGQVDSYTVTASPGGRSIVVGSAARAATLTGLTNGTTYRFTVVARNAGGSSAPASTGSVAPTASSLVTAVAPVRLVDTRHGTVLNPVRTALKSGGSLTLRVAGLSSSPVPSSAAGAQLHVTVLSSSGGWLTTPSAPVAFGAAQTSSSSRLFPLTNRAVTFTNRSNASVQVVVDVEGYAASTGSRWTATPHSRVVDTRTGTRSNSRAGAIPAGATMSFKIAGVTGSPAPASAAATLLNLSAVSTRGAGYLTVNGNSSTSALSFGAGSTVASTALLRAGPGGTITVTNRSAAPLNLLIDVQAYGAATGGGWTQVPQTRVLSSSVGTVLYPSRLPLAPNASVTVRVRDAYGTPLPKTAVAAQVAISVNPVGSSGYLVGSATRSAPSLFNFSKGGPVSNTAVVPIAADGTVTFTNVSAAALVLVVDVTGYLSS